MKGRNPFINQVNSDIINQQLYHLTIHLARRNPFINQVNSDEVANKIDKKKLKASQSLHKSGQFGLPKFDVALAHDDATVAIPS